MYECCKSDRHLNVDLSGEWRKEAVSLLQRPVPWLSFLFDEPAAQLMTRAEIIRRRIEGLVLYNLVMSSKQVCDPYQDEDSSLYNDDDPTLDY